MLSDPGWALVESVAFQRIWGIHVLWCKFFPDFKYLVKKSFQQAKKYLIYTPPFPQVHNSVKKHESEELVNVLI